MNKINHIIFAAFIFFVITKVVKSQEYVDIEEYTNSKLEKNYIDYFIKELWEIDSCGYLNHRTKIFYYLDIAVMNNVYTIDRIRNIFGKPLGKSEEDNNLVFGYLLNRNPNWGGRLEPYSPIIRVMKLYFNEKGQLYKCSECELDREFEPFYYWNKLDSLNRNN